MGGGFKAFPKGQNLDSSKLKEFAVDNSKFDEDGAKFSEKVNNTVEKGEIARSSNFFFSHSVFKRLVLQTRRNQGLFGNGLMRLQNVSSEVSTVGPGQTGRFLWHLSKTMPL